MGRLLWSNQVGTGVRDQPPIIGRPMLPNAADEIPTPYPNYTT